MNSISAIILAAGEGTRMKSNVPKALHTICGKPMLDYVLDLLQDLKIKNIIVVVGYKSDLVKEHLNNLNKKIKIVVQKKLLGTGDAVKQARNYIPSRIKDVIVLYVDTPLLQLSTLKNLVKSHLDNQADCTLLTCEIDEPRQYGRVIRDNFSRITRIVEDKDATASQKSIKEINSGISCFKKNPLFAALKEVKPNNQKKEYYLTDVVEILSEQGKKIESVTASNINEISGINSKEDLSLAESILRQEIIKKFMQEGITIVDPNTTFIDADTKIGQDTIIYPFTVIEKDVKIGKNCALGPFCRIRQGSVIKDKVILGNFVEVVRSTIDNETTSRHFAYLGDTHIGKKVNIGAGTVTANFDGINKNITVIKDGAFIGCDTVLVAPVKVGKKAITGAGSVITKNNNVPDRAVVVGVPARPLTSSMSRV